MRCVALGVALLATTVVANERGWKSYYAPCPEPCSLSHDPLEWNLYSNPERLASCNQTMLMEFGIHNPLDDPNTRSSVYACSAENGISTAGAAPASSCEGNFEQTPVNLHMGSSGSVDSAVSDAESQILDLIDNALTYLASSAVCAGSSIFGTSQNAAVGVYIGRRLENAGAADSILSQFHKNARQTFGRQMVLQRCGTSAKDTLGVAVNMDGDLAAVQRRLQTWAQGGCASGFDRETFVSASLPVAKPASQQLKALAIRSNLCNTVQVEHGDSRASLATECGISDAEFTKYNNLALWSSLKPGQQVCCSPGSLPDMSPKVRRDGTCHTYRVQSGDTCSALAAAYSTTVDSIEKYNQNTWGWMGCGDIMTGQNICLSPGQPPFPAPIQNAVCGPQVPGTKPSWPLYWNVNFCPLNACCDTWGQCGTTPQFCTKTKSKTGAPGTAAPGTNGCINSCEVGLLVKTPSLASESTVAPNWQKYIGYYESSNWRQSCGLMRPNQIPHWYTHVYYAFGLINHDFTVGINQGEQQVFNQFAALKSAPFKRIISFGGWDFSTSPKTYMIFRQGVTSANRGKLVQQVVDFVLQHDLDGVDFDWEYPGAQDIPNIPPSTTDDGPNYLAFLKELRSALPADKTISIAIPSTYWYLRNFPISVMTAYVDWFVFMTYDLAGVWDKGNMFSQAGCPGGTCLRSPVNLTETTYALDMISKAASTEQVVVGVTSYGRSFTMAQPGCWGEMCQYTGPGIEGPCTQTKGVLSNAEIQAIFNNNKLYPGAKWQFSSDSDTDILLYNDNQWVGYMSETTRQSRTRYYETLGFRGTVDWAIDLSQSWTDLKCNSPGVHLLMQEMPPNYGAIWSTLRCDQAWAEALSHWENKKASGFQFSQVIAAYFGRPSINDITCANLTLPGNGCDSDTASALGCEGFSSPAGFPIMQSLMNIDNKYLEMYNAIETAQAYATDDVSKLSHAFSPTHVNSNKKVILDAVSLGLALILSPCWNKVWKDVAKAKKLENELGTVKDWVNPIISQSITIAKDVMKSGVSVELASQSAISDTIGQVTKHWQAGLTATVSHLFDGSSSSNQLLYHMIKDGMSLSEQQIFTTDEWKSIFLTSLYTILIPELWSLKGYSPFILDSGKQCVNGKPPAQGDHLVNTFPNTWFCHQGRLYFFVATYKTGRFNKRITRVTPPNFMPVGTFYEPAAVEQLDGKKWGKITINDIILSCLRAYEANGSQNGWTKANPTNYQTLNDIIHHGVAAAGVWPFPVCGAAEADRNWATYKRRGVMSKHYPCD